MFLRANAELLPGRVHLRRGEVEQAIPFLERSIRFAQDADFPLNYINAASKLGYAYNLAQRPQNAVSMLEHAWGLAEPGGFLHWGVICLMHLADAYSLTGHEPKARTAIDRALTISRGAARS